MPHTITTDDSAKQASVFVEYTKGLGFARTTKIKFDSSFREELSAKGRKFKEMFIEKVKEVKAVRQGKL